MPDLYGRPTFADITAAAAAAALALANQVAAYLVAFTTGTLSNTGARYEHSVWTTANYLFQSSDHYVENDTTGGAKASTLPAAVDDRVLILANAAAAGVTNAWVLTRAGSDIIKDPASTNAATSISLVGAQSVTLRGRTGVGWTVT